jgi:hypothetical protein
MLYDDILKYGKLHVFLSVFEFGRQNFQSINFSIDFPLIDLDLKRFGQLSIETFEYVISSPGFDFGYLLLHFSKGTPL